MGPTKREGPQNWVHSLTQGSPQDAHEKSSHSKPDSKASKVMTLGSKATTKHQKLTLAMRNDHLMITLLIYRFSMNTCNGPWLIAQGSWLMAHGQGGGRTPDPGSDRLP